MKTNVIVYTNNVYSQLLELDIVNPSDYVTIGLACCCCLQGSGPLTVSYQYAGRHYIVEYTPLFKQSSGADQYGELTFSRISPVTYIIPDNPYQPSTKVANAVAAMSTNSANKVTTAIAEDKAKA